MTCRWFAECRFVLVIFLYRKPPEIMDSYERAYHGDQLKSLSISIIKCTELQKGFFEICAAHSKSHYYGISMQLWRTTVIVWSGMTCFCPRWSGHIFPTACFIDILQSYMDLFKAYFSTCRKTRGTRHSFIHSTVGRILHWKKFGLGYATLLRHSYPSDIALNVA